MKLCCAVAMEATSSFQAVTYQQLCCLAVIVIFTTLIQVSLCASTYGPLQCHQPGNGLLTAYAYLDLCFVPKGEVGARSLAEPSGCGATLQGS